MNAAPPSANPQAVTAPAAPRTARVALLLPLTGPNAAVGQGMLRAARLSLPDGEATQLDSRDTGGTPTGAMAAARAALAAGDGLILGPLTAPETAAIAPIAAAGHVPVLAFTSDPAQAHPGVWTLGLTPAQQVRRLVAAAQAEGKTRMAALLPENSFGQALSAGLTQAAATASLPPPQIRTYADIGSAAAALKAILPPDGTGFDTLLLAETGDRLQTLLPALSANGVAQPQVRVLGPALWAKDPRLTALAGAWYAAPDPALRGTYETRYREHYGSAAPTLGSIAYDAAALARVLDGHYDAASLTRSEGFSGTDGLLALEEDGHVRRGLAVFELQQAGPPHMTGPSPQLVTSPGV